MKRTLIIITLLLCFLLSGCSNNKNSETASGETGSVNYTSSIELAQKEFHTVFSEFADLHIVESKTMAGTRDENHFIVEFTYSSANGDGVYGFEFTKDAYNNYELIRQGEGITIDELLQAE